VSLWSPHRPALTVFVCLEHVVSVLEVASRGHAGLQEATGIAADNTAQKTEEGKAAAEVKKVTHTMDCSRVLRFTVLQADTSQQRCIVPAQDETKEQLEAARSHAHVKTVRLCCHSRCCCCWRPAVKSACSTPSGGANRRTLQRNGAGTMRICRHAG
jgi:hypothetical protein